MAESGGSQSYISIYIKRRILEAVDFHLRDPLGRTAVSVVLSLLWQRRPCGGAQLRRTLSGHRGVIRGERCRIADNHKRCRHCRRRCRDLATLQLRLADELGTSSRCPCPLLELAVLRSTFMLLAQEDRFTDVLAPHQSNPWKRVLTASLSVGLGGLFGCSIAFRVSSSVGPELGASL